MQYKAPRGTSDILPDDQKYWRYVEAKAVDQCLRYGYKRLDTPAFEDFRLFARSIGEGTDIVTKEMYVFNDRSGNTLALRPEGTASVCRAYLEHGLSNLPQPVKVYYLTALFRYERPQAGRYRQHHQFGFEVIGDADPALDAEVIDMAWNFYISMGLGQLDLKVNSIGCSECRPSYLEELQQYYSGHINDLCSDCRDRIVKNPLRLLDCKQATCFSIAEAAPKSVDYLCTECGEHFYVVQHYLKLLTIPYEINHRLVRGLDYYTRTVFEIQPPGDTAQSSVGGGGRYDGLIEELGGQPTPAIGFAAGIERIVLNLKKQDIAVPELYNAEILIAHQGKKAKDEAVKLASELRRKGVAVIVSLGERSLKAQLRQANNLGCSYVAILGDEELKNNTISLRNMTTGEQQSVVTEKIPELLGIQIL